MLGNRTERNIHSRITERISLKMEFRSDQEGSCPVPPCWMETFIYNKRKETFI